MDISIVNKGAIRLVDGKIIHVTDDNNPGNSFERLETIGLILVDGRSGISSLHEDNLKNSDFFERIKQYIGKLSSGPLVMRIKVYIAQKGSTGGRTSKVVELRLHGKDKLTRALKRLEPGIMIHVVLTDLKDHQTMSVYGAGLGKRQGGYSNKHDMVWVFGDGNCEKFENVPQTPITGSISIIIGSIKSNIHQPMTLVPNVELPYLKRMLDEGIGSDVNLIPRSGNPVKAHKSFLMTLSPVFGAVFGKHTQDSRNRDVEVKDISEDGLKAFLAYLYYSDTSRPNISCSVALELLQASRKYQVSDMEKSMQDLLLQKTVQWFDVVSSIKLFLLATNFPLEIREKLKRKAAHALKSNASSLENASVYREFFDGNVKAALELSVLLAKE